MNTKTLSPRALSVIDQYEHFRMGSAVCSVPYFNNKTTKSRAALRVFVGKGSPKDIFDEMRAFMVKNHIDDGTLADESLKKLLTDGNIGVDCSAFAYYVLNAENEERGKGGLDKHISFVNCHGIAGKLRAKLRPVENCDVATIADNANSKLVHLNEVQPGDMITMTGSSDEMIADGGPMSSERDHILVVHQVEYQNFVPYQLHYSHAVAYPEDGVYGNGIKQGVIEIENPIHPLAEARWSENGLTGDSLRIFIRAKKSKTEVRRLNWF